MQLFWIARLWIHAILVVRWPDFEFSCRDSLSRRYITNSLTCQACEVTAMPLIQRRGERKLIHFIDEQWKETFILCFFSKAPMMQEYHYLSGDVHFSLYFSLWTNQDLYRLISVSVVTSSLILCLNIVAWFLFFIGVSQIGLWNGIQSKEAVEFGSYHSVSIDFGLCSMCWNRFVPSLPTTKYTSHNARMKCLWWLLSLCHCYVVHHYQFEVYFHLQDLTGLLNNWLWEALRGTVVFVGWNLT